MRVLLISFYFPPSSSIGTLRAGKTAKYLLQFGHDVHVITAALQPGLPQTLPVEMPVERVHRISWPTSETWIGRILARRRAGAAGAARGSPAAPTLLHRLVSRGGVVFRELAHFPDEGGLGLAHALRASSAVLRSWRPDLILASASPASALVLASLLSRRFGIPWVAELRDLWTDNHLYPYSAFRRTVERALETRVLRTATGVVTVSEPLAATLRAKAHRPTAVVLNGFDPADYPPDAVRSGDERLSIVFTGQNLSGQNPLPLVEAIALLGSDASSIRLVFHGRFLHPAIDRVFDRAAALGVTQCVSAPGAITHREALAAQLNADVHLMLTWSDPASPGVYTGKLFEYIGARRPILAIGPVQTVADDLIERRRLGVSLRDPQQIAVQLQRWLEEKRSSGRVAPIPRERGADLTREEQTRVLSTFLEQCLSSHVAARSYAY